jgi:hypothetical protein
MIYLPRPANCEADSLHAQIAAVGLGTCGIEWQDDELGFRFDDELTAEQQARLSAVVAAHDGSTVIAERAEKKLRAEQLVADSQAIVDAARAKRLAGEPLTQQELAAIADIFMFQGFQPQ